MKIVITGGHMSPALSIIEELPKDAEVLIIGRKYGLEGDKALSLEYLTAQKLDIPFKALTTGRLQRKFTKHTIKSLFKFPHGIFQAITILKEFKPDIVFTFGGYVALPVAFAAFVLKIPVIVHEQTLEAGLANRIIATFAKKIFISWDSSKKFFPKNKTVLTGNPIREFQISNFKFQISKEKIPLIYITGGSSGSHKINVLMEGSLEELLKNYKVLHQTGDAREYMDFERLEKLKSTFSRKLQDRYILTKFIEPEEVYSILEEASLVISRSGINTVTELISVGRPAILIPLPYSQNNEQFKNARFYKSLGLGELLDQNKISSKDLLEMIDMMMKNISNYKKNAESAKKQLISNSSSEIVKLLQEIK